MYLQAIYKRNLAWKCAVRRVNSTLIVGLFWQQYRHNGLRYNYVVTIYR